MPNARAAVSALLRSNRFVGCAGSSHSTSDAFGIASRISSILFGMSSSDNSVCRTCDVAARVGERVDKPRVNGIKDGKHHNRNGTRRLLRGSGGGCPSRHKHIHLELEQFGCERR